LFSFAAVAMTFFPATSFAAYNQGDHFWVAPEIASWYDSNIFRKADSDNSIAKREDQVWQPKVTAHFDTDLSRQNVFIDSSVFSRNYQQHSDLNYTGVNNTLGWNWAAGSDWGGVLQYTIAHDLSSFENINTAQSDMYTSNNVNGSVIHKITSHWQLLADASADNESHSMSNELDLNSTGLGGGVRYVTDKGSEIVIRHDHSAIKYKNDYFIWAAEDRGYQQDANQLILSWPISDKLKTSLNFGQVKWSYDSDSTDGSSSFGGAKLEWQTTEKTKLTSSYNRQMSMPKQSLDTTMSDTYSVGGAWQTTDKLGFDVSYRLNSQKYTGTSARTDDTKTYRLNCNWSPWLNWMSTTYLQYQKRDSDLDSYIYTANTVGISLQYKY
jgi:hypothetical protein